MNNKPGRPKGSTSKDPTRTIRVMVNLTAEEDAIITAAQSRMSTKGKGTCLRRLALKQAEEKTMTTLGDNEVRKITSLLIDGLTTDGAHHKQYFLEEALRAIAPDEYRECKSSWKWDDGIAP